MGLPKEPSRGRCETYAGLGQQARLQLAARSVPLPPLEYLPIEAGRGLARLPEPSPGDVFLDSRATRSPARTVRVLSLALQSNLRVASSRLDCIVDDWF
jgi:hypothetical protein